MQYLGTCLGVHIDLSTGTSINLQDRVVLKPYCLRVSASSVDQCGGVVGIDASTDVVYGEEPEGSIGDDCASLKNAQHADVRSNAVINERMD